MSKRKRTTPKDTPPETPSEGTEGDPTVHVTSDMLAGSPDIFAPSKESPEAAADEAATDEPATDATGSEEAAAPADEPAPVSEDVSMTSAETPSAPATPDEAIAATPLTPPYQPRPPAYAELAHPSRRASTSVALGVVLVVLGLFALVVQVTGFDPGGSWPLFVIIPGLTLLIVGFISFGTGALIPGAILTVVGLILAYMNASQDWPAWAFVWPLVAPGGVGLGIWLQGLRTHDAHLLRQGRVLMFVALIIFMIGFVIFGTIFRISDTDYGWFGKAALPALLIVIGIVLLARSIQRSRSA
ncbi:MAG TPA: hypothetical protein VG426_03940 [Candidatus Dormibacteraeota bacterium]|jgi:hypothetical protein|nr:hypothetical protein [Candidatus Dormibacteraeota bacterium]